ncbi:MAG: glycosyl transferase family 1 [Treponema sp. CETP13]|nr:MAG: glycosyl transferase family 1 [Treponema sp. CETP13]
MNIALFTDAYFPRINGVSISVSSYAKELINIGHTVLVVASEYPDEKKIASISDFDTDNSIRLEDNIPVLRIKSMRVFVSKEDRLARFDKWFYIKKKLDQFKPDIIHVNSELMIGYYGVMYARHRKIGLVFTFHTMWEDYIKGYLPVVPSTISKKFVRDHMHFYLKYATEIIAPTEEIKQVVSDYGIDNRFVHLLPTGISENFFVNDKQKTKLIRSILLDEYPKLKDKKILLYVGRIAKEKNLDFLLDVIEKIHASRPDTVLLYVGAGPYLEDLQQHCKKRGLDKYVVFTGYINRLDLPAIYHLSDVFTFASKSETQGLVTVEAMISGLPVVAIGERGTLNVMQGDNGGFMVHDSISEFIQKVELLLDDKNIYLQKKVEALEWGKKWTIESMTPRLIAIYESAVEKMKGKNTKW